MKRIPVALSAGLLACGLWSAPVIAQRATRAARPAETAPRAINGTIIRVTPDTLTLEETFVLNKDTARPSTLLPGEAIRVHYREENARHIATKVQSMLESAQAATAELRVITGRVISSSSDRLTLETVFAVDPDTTKPTSMGGGESVRIQYRDEGTRHVAVVIERAPAPYPG